LNKPPSDSPDREIIKSFEAGGVVEYLEYLQSGKRILLTNFKAGVAKGLGLTLGMTMVLGLAAWILTMLVDLPVVGEYARIAEEKMHEFQEANNYNDELTEMNELLREIRDNMDSTR
jgi:hypothetical protein